MTSDLFQLPKDLLHEVVMRAIEIYYNFITKNQAINCCPYELAMPEMREDLKDVKNKWLGLIYRSKAQ